MQLCLAVADLLSGPSERRIWQLRAAFSQGSGQNGVRERAFGSLKYEHLYRIEIEDLPNLARGAEHYRHVFQTMRHILDAGQAGLRRGRLG